MPMQDRDVWIVGAGMAGLSAGRALAEAGLRVGLLEKGRGPGGRVATRRQGVDSASGGRWDHGAQFVTLREAGLRAHLDRWGVLDGLEDWMPSPEAGLMRLRPRNGMNAMAKALARGLDQQLSTRVVKFRASESTWELISEDGNSFRAPRVIFTLPVPQFLELADASSLHLSETERAELRSIQVDPTLCLLAETEGPSGLTGPGEKRIVSGILDCIVDQHLKGISSTHTLTAFARADFSREWMDRDRGTATALMRAALQAEIPGRLREVQAHLWRYARVTRGLSAPCYPLRAGLVLAGDGFAADSRPGRIETAIQSGLAAAEWLSSAPAAIGVPTTFRPVPEGWCKDSTPGYGSGAEGGFAPPRYPHG